MNEKDRCIVGIPDGRLWETAVAFFTEGTDWCVVVARVRELELLIAAAFTVT